MAEVIIDLAPDGTVNMEVNGIKGKGCEDATDAFIKALDGESESDKKRDYFERPATGTHNRVTS